MIKKFQQVFTGQNVDFNSNEVDMDEESLVSCQVRTTNESSFTGIATVEISNDPDVWISLSDTATDLTGNDAVFFDLQTAANYIRINVHVTTGEADFEFDWVLK
jgi:hypothetical protein